MIYTLWAYKGTTDFSHTSRNFEDLLIVARALGAHGYQWRIRLGYGEDIENLYLACSKGWMAWSHPYINARLAQSSEK